MEFPNFGNLEWILELANKNPQFNDYELDTRLRLPTPVRFTDEELDDVALILLEQVGDNFDRIVHPDEGSIEFYDRFQRLPRLADGVYDVQVSSYHYKQGDKVIEIPSAVIRVEHKRTHHPVARFDETRYEPDNHEPITEIDFEGNNVTKVVNLRIRGNQYSTTYSSFITTINLDPQWEKINSDIEELYDGKLREYLVQRETRLNDMLSAGASHPSIRSEIKNMDALFLKEHGETIDRFVEQGNMIGYYHTSAISRILGEYNRLTGGLVVLDHSINSHFAVDFQGRVIVNDIEADRPLTKRNLSRTKMYTREEFPFNDTFQSDIKKRLSKELGKKPDYAQKAESLLYDAHDLWWDGKYGPSIKTAATAFEVALRGFIIDRGVKTKEVLDKGEEINGRRVMYGMGRLMNELFDNAVRIDLDKETGKNYFNRRIKRKIISYERDSPEQYTTMTAIRNSEAHWGESVDGQSSNTTLAQIAVQVYTEATRFITEKGWRVDAEKQIYPSEMLIWAFPSQKGNVPRVVDNSVVDMMRRSYNEVEQLLHPLEAKYIRDNLPSTSWVNPQMKV